MGRAEVTISPPIPGGARTIDRTYPSPQTQIFGNVAVGIQWLDRQGLSIQDEGTVTGFGVPPQPSQWMMWKGRQAFRFSGSGASGSFYLTGGNFAVFFPQNRGGGSFVEETRCWRITMLAAFDVALGAGDLGLEVGPGLNYDMVTGTPPGFQIAPTGAAAFGVRVRQNGGGAFTVNQALPGVYDITEWNLLEMRFIGATDTTDAVFKTLINGVPLTSFNWGAGTLLPDWGNGITLGYSIGVGNRGATAGYLAACGLSVNAAATEGGLL